VLVGIGMAGQTALHLTVEARMAHHKQAPAATGAEMGE